ncbi:hypothetical protein HK096_005412 [Nowakowskiella sp. JEL0078]|nr:hypothetical protein HK096_005412 [Nowakowskiella sp. JEL0078]
MKDFDTRGNYKPETYEHLNSEAVDDHDFKIDSENLGTLQTPESDLDSFPTTQTTSTPSLTSLLSTPSTLFEDDLSFFISTETIQSSPFDLKTFSNFSIHKSSSAKPSSSSYLDTPILLKNVSDEHPLSNPFSQYDFECYPRGYDLRAIFECWKSANIIYEQNLTSASLFQQTGTTYSDLQNNVFPISSLSKTSILQSEKVIHMQDEVFPQFEAGSPEESHLRTALSEKLSEVFQLTDPELEEYLIMMLINGKVSPLFFMVYFSCCLLIISSQNCL